MNKNEKTVDLDPREEQRSFGVITGSSPLIESENKTIKISKISLIEFMEALESGFADFFNNKSFSMILGSFFALGGLLFITSLYLLKLYIFINIFLFIFAIAGAFIAAGFYEISLRSERGEQVDAGHLFRAIAKSLTRSESYFVLGFLILSTMVMWMVVTGILYLALFDAELMSFSEFAGMVFTTGQGWTFLIINNMLGLAFATLLFVISAFSFQLLYEHNLDIDQAISTSISAVSQNPVLMLLWAMIIGLAMTVSLAAGFIPLIVVMPILGYSAWHLYRKVITVSTD